jgi:hypothetical protein
MTTVGTKRGRERSGRQKTAIFATQFASRPAHVKLRKHDLQLATARGLDEGAVPECL